MQYFRSLQSPLLAKRLNLYILFQTPILKVKTPFPVPAEGGTIHVTCTNYESFWFSENSVTVDGQPFKAPNSTAISPVLSTPWLKAAVKKNVMTVVVEPNTTSKVRTTRFEITAGDIFAWLTFEQEAKK